MTDMVVGLLYDDYCEHVLMIRKNKPEWQKGKLNGIGGKIKEGETPLQAMVREFHEETGEFLNASKWEHCIEYKCTFNEVDPYTVHFFASLCYNHIWMSSLKCPEEESLEIVEVNNMYNENVIENLRWIVPMLADTYLEFAKPVEIHEA